MARTAPKNAQSTEAPEASTAPAADTGTTQPAETPAPAEVDLTAFQAAVGAALDAAGGDGTLEDGTAQAVVTEYTSLPSTKAKNEARRFVNSQMKEKMLANDMKSARAAMYLEKQLDTAKPTKAPKAAPVPVDPTQDFVDRVASVRLAYNLIANEVPSGVSDDWNKLVEAKLAATAGQVTDYAAYLANLASTPEGTEAPTAPEVDAIVSGAFKLARTSTKGGRKAKGGTGVRNQTYTGPRRQTQVHIEAAFANQPVGTFLKVSEISAATSAEYGDDHPSDGAISSRLSSWLKSGKRPLAGIEPTTQNGLFGAVKTA